MLSRRWKWLLISAFTTEVIKVLIHFLVGWDRG